MKKRKILLFIIFAIIILALLVGCGNEEEKKKKPSRPKQTTAVIQTSKVLGVVNYIDLDNKNISYINVESGAKELYTYTNGTEFLNRSGKSIAAPQVNVGDVVDIHYDSTSLVIKKIQISNNKDVWENSKVTSFSVDENTNSMKIGKTMYFYTEEVGVFSENEKIDIMELNNTMDQLCVRGYKNQVISIVVDKGHGYVSLTGDSLFIGGLISIGDILVRKIEPGMLLPVTEGEYKVEVVKDDYRAEKVLSVSRGKKSILDFSDVEAHISESGNVRFIIDVVGADLYIGDKLYKNDGIITLKTGTYDVTVKAAGYVDYKTEIVVKPEYQVINISMKKEDVEVPTTEKEESTTEVQTPTKVEGETYVSSVNDVTVAGPAGGMVYFDGIYKGIAPVTFDMVTGAHVISIMYDKKINSYSVNLVEGADDVTYDFSDKS